VLVGELAEVLHGSPLLPVNATVTIVPRAGQRERLSTAIPLNDDIAVIVASLGDLVRIAEASDDRARVPALRRTRRARNHPARRPCRMRAPRSIRDRCSG